MLFNSFVFIFAFLPLTFFCWYLACRYCTLPTVLCVLLVASLFFYGWWNPNYLLLLLGSIGVNFILQEAIAGCIDEKHSKKFLILGIVFNLALISVFKYADFFATNLSVVFGLQWKTLNLFLPLGISFFTFQQIACLVDTYYGKIGKIPFYKYALFVAFFPQLIAGPIVLADRLIPQFDNISIKKLSLENLYAGISLFVIGLFKKVVIADTFSPLVAQAFDSGFILNYGNAWLGALYYTFQIYYDFSGYSDMAIGLGKMFNFEIPQNFNSPYQSASIIDFWRRWHMTLSAFLKNYLYIPLGGNRKGKLRRYFNLFLTMLLGGLWHGAGWTFVIWGGIHGLYLIVNHFWQERGYRMPKIIALPLTFVCILIAWVFFRANSATQAFEIIKSMMGLYAKSADITNQDVFAYGNTAPILIISLLVMPMPNAYALIKNQAKYHWSANLFPFYIGILFIGALLYLSKISEFLYFQF